MAKHYINYKKIGLEYCTEEHTFTVCFDARGGVISKAGITELLLQDSIIYLQDFKEVNAEASNLEKSAMLIIFYRSGLRASCEVKLCFCIDELGIHISAKITEADALLDADLKLTGQLNWGEDAQNSTFAVNLERNASDFRVAIGPAASKIDNALFDRLTDSVLKITGHTNLKIQYQWEEKSYRFLIDAKMNTSIDFVFMENYYSNKFNIRYKPINKKNQFPTPPVGWMTWYAVMFNACEGAVLENARLISEKLKDFGVNCIWVDWEWYHSNLKGLETDGSDTFNPSKIKYPNGLKFLSDGIKELGLIPALWTGATNEPNKNEILEKNPNWILANQKEWCGQWWIDISNPEVVDKYIPMVFQQILDWGYSVIKWDCLPVTLRIADEYHHKFFNQDKNTEEAFRDVIKAARETIGENNYMVSCSGENDRSISFALDYFDGARIGGDVFKWEEFIKNAFLRIREYLCYNNIILYADPDVVVIREEFNTLDQAKSRASFVSITGLPYTIGDNLPELDEEHLEIIKRTIPVMDIHPMDLLKYTGNAEVTIMNQAIAKCYEEWNVIDVFNTTDATKVISVNFDVDLHLEVRKDIEYLLYEFWNNEFLGIHTSAIEMSISAFASKVICIRRKTKTPQLLSTSRHISQGAFEVQNILWDEEKCTLYGQSMVVGNDPYTITVFVPQDYIPVLNNSNMSFKSPILEANFCSDYSGMLDWEINFKKP